MMYASSLYLVRFSVIKTLSLSGCTDARAEMQVYVNGCKDMHRLLKP
jgi:hypothetical protein